MESIVSYIFLVAKLIESYGTKKELMIHSYPTYATFQVYLRTIGTGNR